MRIGPALVLLFVTASGCAEAQSPEAASLIEIADGRREEASSEPSAEAAGAVEQALRGAASYWRGQDPDLEEDLRALAAVDGAFTEAGAAQEAVLYLVSLWPRCCPKVGLAVVEGGRLVRNATFEGTNQGLRAVPDLDGDGLDELVLTGTFGMGGQWTTSMTVLSLGADGPTEYASAAISDDACAAGHDGSTAARILAAPGPSFSVERYTKASCEATEWTPDGEAAPLDLDPPAETAYVDLTTG